MDHGNNNKQSYPFHGNTINWSTAGLCFTWGNAVTPGIGQLDNLGYLNAFQKMNRSIENPLFFREKNMLIF